MNIGILTVERGFSHRHSIQLTLGYSKAIPYISTEWRFVPEYKIFINKNKFKGFYTGVYLKYLNDVNLELYSSGNYGGNTYISYKFRHYGGGITFGYQTYIKKHLTLDFLLGIDLRYVTLDRHYPAGYYNGGNDNIMYKKYPTTFGDSRASINLGYKF